MSLRQSLQFMAMYSFKNVQRTSQNPNAFTRKLGHCCEKEIGGGQNLAASGLSLFHLA